MNGGGDLVVEREDGRNLGVPASKYARDVNLAVSGIAVFFVSLAKSVAL